MSIVSIPFTFSAGAVIIAAQHNSNFSTIYNDYNGNIQNVNIASGAGIIYSKLTLTESIVDADISSIASITPSKINLGSNHQGDIFVDTGSGITRLTPGNSGQLLETQGASANPIWVTPSLLSNVLFQYTGQVDSQGTLKGEFSGTTLTPSSGAQNYRFLIADVQTPTYQTVFSTKYTHISNISTVTVYVRIWNNNAGGNDQTNFKLTIGSATGNISGTVSQVTPEWKSFTISVTGLTPGTVYDVTGSMTNAAGNTNPTYCSNIIAFGS